MAFQGRHYRFKQFEFYAERGMITLIDTELAADSNADAHEAIKRIPAPEFMMRAIAARIHGKDFYGSITTALTKMLEDATAACKQAITQGDPTNPDVLSHIVRHKRRRSIIMPSEANALLGPVGGARFRFKDMSPESALWGGASVVPDFTVSARDIITPRRAEMMRRMRASRRK